MVNYELTINYWRTPFKDLVTAQSPEIKKIYGTDIMSQRD